MRGRQSRRLNEATAKFIITQVLFGLKHLHDANVAHRNLKPENVLIRDDGYVMLSDHGLAQMLQVGQWSQTYTGVTGYEAPEQIQMTTD